MNGPVVTAIARLVIEDRNRHDRPPRLAIEAIAEGHNQGTQNQQPGHGECNAHRTGRNCLPAGRLNTTTRHDRSGNSGGIGPVPGRGRGDEPEPSLRQRLNESRALAAVAESRADLTDAVSQSAIEIDVRIVAPDPG